jgi:pimeloyl-ACP methyl ester carboxylesterase
VEEAALGLHQVMTRMRTSEEPLKHAFHKIILVGHSLGSITAIYSEGTYGDADALVVTAEAISPHPLPFDDATIADLLAVPYPTISKEARASLLYYPETADPDVIDYDNTFVRDNIARGSLMSAISFAMNPALIRADLITEPVLVQLGENDVTAPASLGEGEVGFYAGAESVTVEAVPEIGHDFNLHINNEEGWAMIEGWIKDSVEGHHGSCE